MMETPDSLKITQEGDAEAKARGKDDPDLEARLRLFPKIEEVGFKKEEGDDGKN